MKLCKALNINPEKKELISIVGGGGKTSTMFHLSKELKKLGKKVLVTTSTAIFNPKKNDYDNIFFMDTISSITDLGVIKSNSITVIGSKVSEEGKLLGLKKDIINELFNREIFDFILVEADGSKQRPIKAPDVHEPVIPSETTKTIGVIGLDSIGKEINEQNVHRPEIFARITESCIMKRIDEKIIYKLIIDNKGLFKEVPSGSERYLLLNKVEDKRTEEAAALIYNLIRESKFDLEGILFCSFKNGDIRSEIEC